MDYELWKEAVCCMDENLIHSSLDFLKNLEKYTLESKLLACQKYSSKIMACSMVDMSKACQENVMPWELEAFAAYSIVYNSEDAIENLDCKTFTYTISLIRNYWHSALIQAEKRGEYVDDFIMISVLQQFPVQGSFLQKLFRYHYFFTFQNDKLDMRQVFSGKIGVDYEQLEEFASIIFLCFSKEYREIYPDVDFIKILTMVLENKNILSLLSIEIEEYRSRVFSLYGENIIDQYYGLKIQYQYPIISGQGYKYIPSPYLVINAVTESLLNRITYGDNKLRRAIGKEVIETYLYDIVRQLDAVSWISQEIEYQSGRDKLMTPDVIAAEGDAVIFYDTKSSAPSLKLRKFDVNTKEKTIKIYAENVIQIYKQIKNYLQGLFQLDREYSKDNIFGIVVVLEDAALPREKIYEKAYSILQETITLSEEDKNYISSHIKILPLRDIEVMILQNTSLLPDLKAQANTADRWCDVTFGTISTDNGLISSYAEYEQDIQSRINNRIACYLYS